MITPKRPKSSSFAPCVGVTLLLACRTAPVEPSAPPEGSTPGAASPITDREASRAPADRSVPPGEPGKPRIRDDRGIPIPPGSAAARARTGASNPPTDDEALEGAEAPEAPEAPEPSPDEGEQEPPLDEQ